MGIERQTDLAWQEEQLNTLQNECECLFENKIYVDHKFHQLLTSKLEMVRSSFGASSDNVLEAINRLFKRYENQTQKILNISIRDLEDDIMSMFVQNETLANTPAENKEKVSLLLSRYEADEGTLISIIEPFRKEKTLFKQLPREIKYAITNLTNNLKKILNEIDTLQN